MIKDKIKAVLRTIAPTQFAAMMATRENRHAQNFMASLGIPSIIVAVVAECGSTVQSGSFAGMRYITEAMDLPALQRLDAPHRQQIAC